VFCLQHLLSKDLRRTRDRTMVKGQIQLGPPRSQFIPTELPCWDFQFARLMLNRTSLNVLLLPPNLGQVGYAHLMQTPLPPNLIPAYHQARHQEDLPIGEAGQNEICKMKIHGVFRGLQIVGHTRGTSLNVPSVFQKIIQSLLSCREPRK
jgi:hypothetical protein